MNKDDAKEQFNGMTEKLDLEHTFPFDIAWAFMEYYKTKTNLENPISFIPSEYTQEEFRKGIKQVENKMVKSNKCFEGKDAESFNPLKHSFANGLYIREIFNPAGQLLVTKIHKTSNAFFLMKGKMTIMSEDGQKVIKAPHYGITKAGTQRIIYTHEDCIFITVHRTDKETVEEAEKEIIAKSFGDIGV